jgi:germination protein M
MRRAVLTLVLIAATAAAAVAAGCGADGGNGGQTASPTAASPTVTASPDATASPSPGDLTAVNVYFLRDGMIGVAQRTLPATTMPATAALAALLEGPNKQERDAGLTTALPRPYELDGVSIKGGTAFVDLTSAALFKMSAKAAQQLLAQVIYTITQFPTVDGAVVTLNGNQLLPSGETGPMDRLLVRADFEDVTPIIFVESPAVGEIVTPSVTISGTANTFEATFIAEVVGDEDTVLTKEMVTATSGTGTRGTFSAQLDFSFDSSSFTLVVYESSAEDGSRINEVAIPLHVVVF